MKTFVLILNIVAAVIMFGLISLVPYVDRAGLGTELYRMEERAVFNQEPLDSYLNEHNAMAGGLDRNRALTDYLYGRTSLARPFLSGALIAFLANAVLIWIFWHPQSAKTISRPDNESPSHH